MTRGNRSRLRQSIFFSMEIIGKLCTRIVRSMGRRVIATEQEIGQWARAMMLGNKKNPRVRVRHPGSLTCPG
jgi:hypothetical protein